MTLAGYSSLIYMHDLKVPLPESLSAISQKHKRYKEDNWTVFTIKYKPDATLIGHLTFALKYEGVDLLVLKKLFGAVDKREIKQIVEDQPTGRYSRRIWFFYEWLTGERLELPDVKRGNYVDALDSMLQYPGPERRSKRHRVRNNLPGNKNFCPLIRRTEKLENILSEDLDKKVQAILDDAHPYILTKAAAFLLLKDTKASYAIEEGTSAENRPKSCEKAIEQAGHQKLTAAELLQLQEIVIKDQRFVSMGWRKEEGFVGIQNHDNNDLVPDHIAARWQDIPQLIKGFIKTNELLAESEYDPVLTAALMAFGFAFIHPFADGNGRIHRYLIHHVLAKKGFVPKELVFPISTAILKHMDYHKDILASFSKPRLDFIDWEPTPNGNIKVLNNTIDLYRYFDATKQAEFLYDCVKETVLNTLPEELQHLEQHAQMRDFIKEHFNMPDKYIETLIGLLHQNNGILSKQTLPNTFKALTDDEVAMLTDKYRDVFGH